MAALPHVHVALKSAQQTPEWIIKGGGEFVDVGLERRAQDAVAKLESAEGSGSGCLVDGRPFGLPENCILTNNHVLSDAKSAASWRVQFYFDSVSTSTVEAQLEPHRGFVTDSAARLDYAICAVRRVDGMPQPLSLVRDPDIEVGKRFHIVQHPSGRHKQVSQDEIKTAPLHSDTVLRYIASTLPGSSGSPVFNHKYQIIAVHATGSSIYNAGVLIRCVWADILDKQAKTSRTASPASAAVRPASAAASAASGAGSPSAGGVRGTSSPPARATGENKTCLALKKGDGRVCGHALRGAAGCQFHGNAGASYVSPSAAAAPQDRSPGAAAAAAAAPTRQSPATRSLTAAMRKLGRDQDDESDEDEETEGDDDDEPRVAVTCDVVKKNGLRCGHSMRGDLGCQYHGVA